MHNYIPWILTKKTCGAAALVSLVSVLVMNNYNLAAIWWCCTHTVHSCDCIFNNSWAGLWPCDLSECLLSVAEAGGVFVLHGGKSSGGWWSSHSCRKLHMLMQRNPIVDVNLNTTPVSSFRVGSILICTTRLGCLPRRTCVCSSPFLACTCLKDCGESLWSLHFPVSTVWVFSQISIHTN